MSGKRTPSWIIINHACRYCLGRVLRRAGRYSPRLRCAQCCHSADGGFLALCYCADCGTLGNALECFKNTQRSLMKCRTKLWYVKGRFAAFKLFANISLDSIIHLLIRKIANIQ